MSASALLSPGALWFLVAAAAVVAVHLLVPPRGGRMRVLQAVAGLVCGLVLVTWATETGRAALGWLPKSDIVRERVYRQPDLGDGPVLLFVGASYTRSAIDPDRVNGILAEAGVKTRIMTRAAGGATRLEQWRFVEEAIETLGRPPEGVFLEISHSLDHRPVYALRSKNSERTVSQFDWRGTRWALEGLALSDGIPAMRGFEDRPAVVRGIAEHFLANALNIGEAHHLVDRSALKARSSFVPRRDYDRKYDAAKIAAGLRPEPWETGERKLGPRPLNPWIEGWLADVSRLLRERGTELRGFYAPPFSRPNHRRYAARFCKAQALLPCLNANRRDLLDRLEPEMWIDSMHLRAPGAELMSDWFALELVNRGLVE